MNTGNYIQIQPQRIKFPTELNFTNSGDNHLVCNGKKVKVVPSGTIVPNDFPPTDATIDALGKHSFCITDADIYIFGIINLRANATNTDCVIVLKDELLSRLNPHHYDEDRINIKLFLTSKDQLIEFEGLGGEAFFIHAWMNRDFSQYLNNWSVFNT
jgi:hypothetical protein